MTRSSAESRGYAFDLAHWPIAVSRVQRTLSGTEYRAYLRGLDSLLAHMRPFALVLVSPRSGSGPTREMVRLQAQWLSDHREAYKRYCVGTVIVQPRTQPAARFITRLFLSRVGRGRPAYTFASDEREGLLAAERMMAAFERRQAAGVPASR